MGTSFLALMRAGQNSTRAWGKAAPPFRAERVAWMILSMLIVANVRRGMLSVDYLREVVRMPQEINRDDFEQLVAIIDRAVDAIGGLDPIDLARR